MSLDFSRSRLPPFRHQAEDTERVVNSPWLFITSEMRTGKTKIVIDAAQFLYEAGSIDNVVVIAPNPVRDVWYDPELGEIAKHSWHGLSATVTEFHSKSREWFWGDPKGSWKDRRLRWTVTNYEFIRSKSRLAQLLQVCSSKTLLVLDESSFVKTWNSAQTKACGQVRRKCGRVVELNGTPISQSYLDLFSQANLLHESVIGCRYITHFKAEYAVMEPIRRSGGGVVQDSRGNAVLTISGWKNIDKLERKMAPFVVRRLQKDCLDLPPKLDPVTLTARLDDAEWAAYKEMREQLVVWFKDGTVSSASQAAVMVMRLSQITSGFVGGVEPAIEDETDSTVREMLIDQLHGIREIGRSKLDVLLWFLKLRLEEEPNLHVVTWCRFRPEVGRMVAAVQQEFPQFLTGFIVGGQPKDQRRATMELLNPLTSPKGPVFVGGTFGTGAYGLNFTAANTSINLSFDYSLGKFLQSADRVYGPGQVSPVAYFDVVATGPKGQRTIDHEIVAARRSKQNLADYTTEKWIQAISRE